MTEFSPVKLELKADLTETSTEFSKGICKGVSKLAEAIIGPYLAKIRADNQRTEAQAAADSKLIESGLARFENGRMIYLADTVNCAEFLVSSRDQRRIENLSACLNEAAKAIDEDPTFSSSGKEIEPDFLDEWQDSAEHTNSDYMRTLWGRILKGELQYPGRYPRRILGILRNLTVEEAELFTKIARYAVDGVIVLPTDESRKLLGNTSLLCDSGLFSSSLSLSVSYPYNNENFISIPAADCALVLHFSKPLSGKKCTLSGYVLNNTGKSLLKLPDIEKLNKNHLEKIFLAIKNNINELMQITAHQYIDDNQEKIMQQICVCQYPEIK